MINDLLSQLRVQSRGRQSPRCELPGGHSCAGGWHIKWSAGWKTAYERCAQPRRALERIFEAQTFDTFEAGREDAALASMRRFAAGEVSRVVLAAPPSDVSALIPRVTTGSGKTHLLRAARAQLEAAGRWVVYLDCYQWQHAKWSDEGATQRDSWLRCDVLLLDHLGREREGRDGLGPVLEAIVDQRGEKALAVASDLSRGGLVRRYGEGFVSRLWGGAEVPEVVGRDYRGERR